MSHIFDGLQRSEGEIPGVDSSALAGVTQLLRHAERRVASKWEATVLPEQPDVAKSSEPWLLDEPLDLFAQIQSLQVSPPPQSRLPCLTDSGSPAAEAFRLLGVRLRQLRRDPPLKKVLVTSPIPREGKSTVAANLACTLSSGTQERTLLLEGDLRRPSLSHLFGLGWNPGLSELLENSRSLTTSIYRLENPNIWILPAGRTPGNALKLLQSGRLATLMDELSILFDWIIVDSPPVLPLADTSVWMSLADGILLTTRQGTTEKRQLQRGLDAVESKKLIGAVVNSSKNATANNYYDNRNQSIAS